VLRAINTEGGYVNFNDGKRVAHKGRKVTGSTGNWLPITPTHIRLARAFLETQGALSSGE
jgi:hypothetical protein